MSEPKVIELTEKQVFNLFSRDGLTIEQRDEAVTAVKNGGLLIKAPQPKLVRLSDLPDGTVIDNDGYNRFLFGGRLYCSYSPNLGYKEGCVIQESISLIPGGFQPWMGGECPWPEGVEVEIEYYLPNLHTSPDRKTATMNASEVAEFVKHRDYIIAHRCTGRLIDGAKLVP